MGLQMVPVGTEVVQRVKVLAAQAQRPVTEGGRGG